MATKVDVINYVMDVTGLSKRDAIAAYEAIMHYTTVTLALGDVVRLHGFGSFTTVRREATTGRNPRTGTDVKIPAKTVAKFKPALALKQAIQA